MVEIDWNDRALAVDLRDTHDSEELRIGFDTPLRNFPAYFFIIRPLEGREWPALAATSLGVSPNYRVVQS